MARGKSTKFHKMPAFSGSLTTYLKINLSVSGQVCMLCEMVVVQLCWKIVILHRTFASFYTTYRRHFLISK